MATVDPRVDAYIAKSAPFAQPLLAYLREVVHAACPQAEETLKWGMPSFTWRGKILCGMAAFKQHVTLWFWQGRSIVGEDSRREAMGQFGRITKKSELPGRRELSAYVKQAMARVESDAAKPARKKSAPKAAARPELDVPDDLAAALRRNAKARATFDGFAPGYRRDYIEWIVEAKREDTRAKRVAQTVEWLAEGKTRNWKYVK